MALKIKEVHPSVVGESGSRLAFAIYDGSKLVHKTTRGGGRGSPMYGLTEKTAKRLLAKEQAKRAAGGKAPKATRASASTSRPSRQKLDRQELTISGCTQFLRAEGYSVSKRKRKQSEPLDEGLLEYQALLMENPRKRKNPRSAFEQALWAHEERRFTEDEIKKYKRDREIRRRVKGRRVKGRSSWQQYLRLMKGKGYSMDELRAGYRQLKKKYPNNTKQLLAAARKLPVKRKNPRALRRLR